METSQRHEMLRSAQHDRLGGAGGGHVVSMFVEQRPAVGPLGMTGGGAPLLAASFSIPHRFKLQMFHFTT